MIASVPIPAKSMRTSGGNSGVNVNVSREAKLDKVRGDIVLLVLGVVRVIAGSGLEVPLELFRRSLVAGDSDARDLRLTAARR